MPHPFAGFLRALRLEREEIESFREYPFSIPAIRDLQRLEFHPAVTFFVGENGSGKSTLLEALAIRSRINAEGGSRNSLFETRPSHSDLYQRLTLERNPRYPEDLFFLRAESFYNTATYLENVNAFSGLHELSHGQSFFAVMENRLFGNGLYLFDELESALSPQRQMSALTLIDDLVHQNSQFVIATHSPILMAYPHAFIYEFGPHGIRRVAYEETEQYQVTRDFLNRRESMLGILLDRRPGADEKPPQD